MGEFLSSPNKKKESDDGENSFVKFLYNHTKKQTFLKEKKKKSTFSVFSTVTAEKKFPNS